MGLKDLVTEAVDSHRRRQARHLYTQLSEEEKQQYEELVQQYLAQLTREYQLFIRISKRTDHASRTFARSYVFAWKKRRSSAQIVQELRAKAQAPLPQAAFAKALYLFGNVRDLFEHLEEA